MSESNLHARTERRDVGRQTVTCPSTVVDDDGTIHTIIGCGSVVSDAPDDEGFYDCGVCGMFFQTAQSRAAAAH